MTSSVLMTVHCPSLLTLNSGLGRFLFMNVKVAASTAIPHSIRMRREVRTVKRASPTFTTDEGFGFGLH